MEALVLSPNLEVIGILDTFESFIWSDRYDEPGDFEVYTKVSDDILALMQKDNYLWMKDTDHLMIIESITIKFDAVEGNTVIFGGHSAESILSRRIIWNQTVLTGNLQNGIQLLLNENVISPTDTNRTIPNIIFEQSTDTAITSLTIDAQFIRTNLLENISDICKSQNIGFKIAISEDLTTLVFKLYAGANRTYSQFVNPYVIFSPEYDNLISSEYKESKETYKTVTLVVGEGDEGLQKTTIVGDGIGLNRRELFTDGSGISQTVDQVLIPDDEYITQLAQLGTEDLQKHKLIMSFTGEVDNTRTPQYGIDFFIGDVVQLSSDYGLQATARITEYIYSQDSSGITSHPTFEIIE